MEGRGPLKAKAEILKAEKLKGRGQAANGLERQAIVPHLKRLFIDRAISGMERSVQFNLLALETMHHGKRTLGSNREATQNQFKVVQQRGFSSVGRASALQAECQRFESVNLHQRLRRNFE